MTLRQHIKTWLYGSCPGFAGRFPYFGVTVHFPRNSVIRRDYVPRVACRSFDKSRSRRPRWMENGTGSGAPMWPWSRSILGT